MLEAAFYSKFCCWL